LPVYRRVFSRIELAPGAYLRALWPAVSASALMAAAVIGLDRAAPADWPLAAVLGVQVLGGAAAYGTALMVLHRERLQAFLSILRRARAQP
ncbi:MAG: hypothetical protein ABR543_16755, partial [Gemmatimonadaceae bacterium]